MNHFLFVLLVVSLQVNTVLWFRYVWRVRSKSRAACARLSLLLHTLLVLFTALELFFCNFVAISDGFGFTLAAQRWRQRYHNPINSFGIRDAEHPLTRLRGKRRLFVIGDSFAAGHGLKDYRQRFGNLVAPKLGDEWEVVVLAKGGWGPRDELAALRGYPIKPHRIVFSYYLNDIEQAGISGGLSKPSVWPSAPRLLAPLVENSDFLNFAYWRLYRYSNASQMGRDYWKFLESCFADTKVWQLHQREIDEVIEFARQNKIEIYAVVFPSLVNAAASDPMIDKVIGHLARQKVETVDVRLLVNGKSSDMLTVNPLDGHPNPEVHRAVADALFELMSRDKAK